MKVIFAFFTSLGIGFAGLFGYLTISNPQKPEVLSAQVQASPSETSEATLLALSTPIPTDSPSPTPSPSPTKSPTPTKTPSPKPTAIPKTPTPSPTPTKSPTPTPSSTPTITPSISPTSTPTATAPANMEPFFAQYSAQYHVDKNQMIKIADCESHFNPNAVNGDYLGIFQFASPTWISKRGSMGLDTNASLRTNAEESIKTAAYTISINGTSPWSGCL